MTLDASPEEQFEQHRLRLIQYAEIVLPESYRMMIASEAHAAYKDTELALKLFTHRSSELESQPQFLRNIMERVAPHLGEQPGMTWNRNSTTPKGSHFNTLTIEGVLEIHASRLNTKTLKLNWVNYRKLLMGSNPLFPFELPEVIDGLKLSAVLEHLPTKKGEFSPAIFRVSFYDRDMIFQFHTIDLLPYYERVRIAAPENAPQRAPEVEEAFEIPLLGEEEAE